MSQVEGPLLVLLLLRFSSSFPFGLFAHRNWRASFSSAGFMHIDGRTYPFTGGPALWSLPKEFLSWFISV